MLVRCNCSIIFWEIFCILAEVIDVGSGTLCLGSAKELCHQTVDLAQKASPSTNQGAWCGMSIYKQTTIQIIFVVAGYVLVFDPQIRAGGIEKGEL